MNNQVECINCGAPVDNYEPEYCCDGRECGCFGRPIEPPVCDKCWDEITVGIPDRNE